MSKYKLSFDSDEGNVIIEFKGECDIYALVDQLRAFLLAVGWHPDTLQPFLGPFEE